MWSLLYKGYALDALQKREEALACYREATAHEGGFAWAHMTLADLLAKQGSSEEAIQHYRAALRLDPRDVRNYLNLAGLLRKRDDRKAEALELYQMAGAMDGKNLWTENVIGELLAEQGKLEPALVHYTRVTQLDPRFIWGHIRLAELLIRMGRAPDAAQQYRQALKMDPACGEAKEALKRMGLK